MYYYDVALLNHPLDTLTYNSDLNIATSTVVEVTLRSRSFTGVIVQSVAPPLFKTTAIEVVLSHRYSALQMKMARFIATYYFCSLGEALKLFTWFSFNNDRIKENIDIEARVPSSITLSVVQTEALALLQQHFLYLKHSNKYVRQWLFQKVYHFYLLCLMLQKVHCLQLHQDEHQNRNSIYF